MSNRKVRVGELVKREISDILHTRLKGQGVLITITEVDVSPDNKNATVLYSVIETEKSKQYHAQRFLEKNQHIFARELSKRIILKYMPVLRFAFDEKSEQANRVSDLLDSLNIPEDKTEEGENENKNNEDFG